MSKNIENNSNSNVGNSSADFSGGSINDKADVDALNNRAKNTADFNTSFRKKDDSETVKKKPSELEKKDGLDDSGNSLESAKPKDTPSKSDSKISDKKKSNLGGIVDKIAPENPIAKLKAKILKIKIGLIIGGVAVGIFLLLIIIGYFIAAFGAFLKVSSFYGVPEADSEKGMSLSESDGLLTKDDYIINSETGDGRNIEELVSMIKEDSTCSKVTFWTGIFDFFDRLDGTFSTMCSYVRYINTYQEKLESEKGVTLDRGLTVASLFYGYASQPGYITYDNPAGVQDKVSAVTQYDSLVDALRDGTITTDDLKIMIDNSVADHSYIYYTWSVEEVPDSNPRSNIIYGYGICTPTPVSDIHYSLLKWKILMRFGEQRAEDYDYWTRRAHAFDASSIECTGAEDDATLLEKIKGGRANVIPSITDSVRVAQDALEDAPVTDLDLFEQAAISSGHQKDYFVDFRGLEFDYTNGFIYKRFPIFEQAFNDGRTSVTYDDAITPKEIESIIELVVDRKPSINEMIQYPDQDDPFRYLSGANTNGSFAMNADCREIINTNLSDIKVEVTDCDGRYITTTDFKDYIMGVAYREVSDINDDYVMTEMVAAISYALARRRNYEKLPNILMRSGTCDQAFCSMKTGCYGKTSNIMCTANEHCMSFYPGETPDHPIASAALYNKYSALYDKASAFLVVKDGVVFGTYYQSEMANGWYAKAASGMSFTQIIQEQYENDGAELINCAANPGSSSDDEDDSPTSSKVGKEATSEYPEVAPDKGKFYGFSYNDGPAGRDILMNPAWKKANLTTVNSNCPEGNWNLNYTVNVQAKGNYEKAFANICKLITTGVKLKNKKTCKLSVSDLKNGDTFVERKTSSGNFSLHAYGLAQDWNYGSSYVINGNTYQPYGADRSVEKYNEFVKALGSEEDCRNVNYILWKYAYEPAEFTWGGNWGRFGYTGTFDGMHFEVRY